MINLVLVSGHGGQVPDTNGDEIDKLDESTGVVYCHIVILVDNNFKLSGQSTSSTTKARKAQER